jgi:PAS domain S-box-containing protein
VTRKQPGSKPAGVLRARAEKSRPQTGSDPGAPPPADIQKLGRDLHVRQMELETHDHELRQSRRETAAILAKYADLYDFAPMGYFTFDSQGLILEANLTGARLLGVEPGSLLHTRFVAHVAPAFRPEFTAHLDQVFATRASQSCALELVTSEGAARQAVLESIAVQAQASGPAQCRTAVSDLTTSQLAEEAWRRSEEKFFLLFDKAPLGYQSLDQEGRILEVNQTWLDLMGYSRDEVQGRRFKAFLNPAHQDLFREHFTRLQAAGEVKSGKWEMLRRDGAIIVTSFHGKVIRDVQGKFLRTYCMFEDITARRQAEQELQKSLSLLHSTLESTADGILVVDRQGNIVRYNSKFMSMWRIPASILSTGDDHQVLSCAMDQLQSPEVFLAKVQELYAHPETEGYYLLDFMDGRIFERYSQPHRLEGEIVGRVWSFRDVTARKQAEAEIHTTIAFLENVIASSVDSIAIVDEHGSFTRWNQAAAEVYGYSAEGLTGLTTFDLYPDKTALEKMLSQLRQDGFVRGYEIDMRKKDGAIAPFSLSIRLFRDEAGKSTGSVCVARDLTGTRKSLAEMNRINARLQSLVAAAEKRNEELSISTPWRKNSNPASPWTKPIL